jgi:Protein of unknown function (DUF3551)
MRYGIVAAATLTAAFAAALSSTSARADDEWCGYGAGDKTSIECGYSSVAQCQSAVGKDGVCFVDPDYGLRTKRPAAQPVNFAPAR